MGEARYRRTDRKIRFMERKQTQNYAHTQDTHTTHTVHTAHTPHTPHTHKQS